jgi:exosortase family protein XrtF
MLYDLWLHPDGRADQHVIDLTLSLSQNILELLGYVVFTDGLRLIGIEGTSGLWIGDSCNAITLCALFSGFIIAYPGNTKRKILFCLAGITSIFLLNVLRVVILAIVDTYSRSLTEFNHNYTFMIVFYGFIFFLWYLWVNKYSQNQQEKKADS